jgi:hypothetical protein
MSKSPQRVADRFVAQDAFREVSIVRGVLPSVHSQEGKLP